MATVRTSGSDSPADPGLLEEILRVNRLREAVRAAPGSRGVLRSAEAGLEERFAPSERLAVYGTLAPGEVNHRVVADLGGRWLEGAVRGRLAPRGWGTTYGFPALRWQPGEISETELVPVRVLISPDLPDHWQRLDGFEGPGYRRILVPVETPDGRGLLTVANLYEGR